MPEIMGTNLDRVALTYKAPKSNSRIETVAQHPTKLTNARTAKTGFLREGPLPQTPRQRVEQPVEIWITVGGNGREGPQFYRERRHTVWVSALLG